MSSFPLVAVDVGNSRTKFGVFEFAAEEGLCEPSRTLELSIHEATPSETLDRIAAWLKPRSPREFSWWIGSVNRPAAAIVCDWLRGLQCDAQIVLLDNNSLPLQTAVPRPDLVGIDRLLNAVAANRLRPSGAPAIVVDLGSAITIDLVTEAGVFAGGVILPGIGTSARAMYEFTDLLPLIDMVALSDPPPVLGTSTTAAMTSGLFWGAVGAIREVVERLGRELRGDFCVFVTGGAAPSVADLIAPTAKYVPYLTLAGIAASTPA